MHDGKEEEKIIVIRKKNKIEIFAFDFLTMRRSNETLGIDFT